MDDNNLYTVIYKNGNESWRKQYNNISDMKEHLVCGGIMCYYQFITLVHDKISFSDGVTIKLDINEQIHIKS